MKRLLNVLGALVSDLTQSELAARGACRCHKFRSGGFGMADQARNHRESGYHSLVALVLAMQADAFVITSGSNWSRLMEELCLGEDMEPRCAMVDVTPWRPHDW